ncbi:signal peptidase II [Caproiciproducens faecalis]|uniref:Lipoprotein signal peptidase n=1 Tax=Caproiciproducens faecalis TaxID=2820301 RepID=A0ABS7DQS5_9FIRM|nr:signal peptidase II [Caproiciproducens faecalis]MBW7573655.1 signal peptidase II [Caproiciproducens faecalis]
MAIIALLLAAAAVAADQILKLLVTSNLQPNSGFNVIDGFFKIFYIQNRGAAFGMLQNQRWFFILVTLSISAVIIYALFKYRQHNFFSYAASVLIIGGGIGNLIDRVLYGYVVDYIYVTFFPPIFNFADCCVTVGTVFLIIHILFFSDLNSNAEKVIRSK